VRVRFVDLPPEDVSRAAVVPGAAVMQCAARMPFDEALAVADSALRHRDVGPRELLDRAESMPARNRTRCLRVAENADGRAANPFESVLRAIAIDVPGLQVEPQVWVDGIGRPDLLDRTRRIVLEADSFEFHGRRQALKGDCERYNAFVTAGWTVIRFAWEHVMFEPSYVGSVLHAVVQPPAQALGSARVRVPA
jgi:very-short-patch-repair endonuclease